MDFLPVSIPGKRRVKALLFLWGKKGIGGYWIPQFHLSPNHRPMEQARLCQGSLLCATELSTGQILSCAVRSGMT